MKNNDVYVVDTKIYKYSNDNVLIHQQCIQRD